jgi:2-C-methyl-D-erythritol 4-phosphate cytidylyltransferase/2-C-methyl-D-erythritol 2,4-cyclodiphosphate synthase
VTVVAGGERRSDSVRAGLDAADADVVLVHDGARPLASPGLVDSVAESAAAHGAAAPVLPVADSLKRAVDGRLIGVDREGLLQAQTPQGARRELLLDAFAAVASTGRAFTDEVGLLEANGVAVVPVPGEATNVKVTEPADLELVRAIVAGRRQPAETRLGVGQDNHPFGPLDGLWLGGVLVPEAPRLYGHSDGDVVLHALATAVLGACGLGDLGRVFPASDRQTLGAPSAGLLGEALDRARAEGWRPATAQLTVVGSRPRLGPARLDEMRARIAELLDLPLAAVGLTASSGNLGGAEGAGRAISASALVTMVEAGPREPGVVLRQPAKPADAP